ncbi:MAG: insulinase family protein [Eubacteriales bacterium]|nr:insulinase family protein [Eubacteriales bacterium]
MQIQNYTVLKEEFIEEVNGTAYLLSHDKTKAKVMLVKNDDNNKVFTIGFRTPPADDTGVPHIIEHSVLCGSRKFPVKDPFVELAKGSLNTFLNAMTYPDKTVYPIASVNDKDFHNLMDVYLDAVFYPNIYSNDKILKQEGWHYDLESAEDALTYNGVVYNEMKGVYSSADSQLVQAVQQALYPDTTYGCDSGGDPVHIPELSYENFLAFHKKYYHPSNSYIYLYGDIDMEKELSFIDESYLKDFDFLQVDSEIRLQKGFEKAKEVTVSYPMTDAEEEENNTYLSYNAVIGNSLDRTLNLAFSILDYAMIDVPGAPVKKALVDAGISNDVYSSYDDSMYQPFYTITAKGCKTEDKDRFVSVLEDVLKEIIEQGIEEKVLLAAINHFEFKLREANYGRYPKGLMYGLHAFDSWLYDENEPFMYFKYIDALEFLKKQVGTSYFTDILNEYLLCNQHKAIVVAVPKKGMNKENEKKMSEALEAYKASLSDDEIARIVQQTKELADYQSEPTPEEDLLSIPLLELSDIGKKAYQLKNREVEIAGVKTLCHDIVTNGIDYVTYHFDLKKVPMELLPYVSLLVALYKEVDTDQRSYQSLSNEIDLVTGGVGSGLFIMGVKEERGDYIADLEFKTKVLHEHLSEALALIEEIAFTSHITDKKRMKEVIAEIYSQLKESIQDSGHVAMATRASSYFSKSAYLKELMEGIGFYEFITDLYKNFEERYDRICDCLNRAIHAFAKKENLSISYTGKDDIEESFAKAISSMETYLNQDQSDVEKQHFDLKARNEGFKTSSKVQYAAAAGNFVKKGLPYTGALHVLQVIFSYDYLWINVRVKGGAYGAMCAFSQTGDSYFTSYRDPNLVKTYEVYEHAAEYVKNFQVSDRDMVKYIIGTIAKLDTPLTPAADGKQSDVMYRAGVSQEQMQKIRDEVLSCNQEAIQRLAPYMEAIFETEYRSALGDEDVIERDKKLFKEIKTLA